MNKGNSVVGIILIVLGGLFLADRYTNFHFASIELLWPLFVLIPGLMFEAGYFSKRDNPGLLVPGGILTVIGGTFLFSTFTNWHYSYYTWPMYLLAVSFGLFQLYWFGKKEKALLIPIGILAFVALSAYVRMLTNLWIFNILRADFVFPVVLILVGILILFKNNNKRA